VGVRRGGIKPLKLKGLIKKISIAVIKRTRIYLQETWVQLVYFSYSHSPNSIHVKNGTVPFMPGRFNETKTRAN